MNDSGFIEAICADPRDTGLRLIYADWLEENGQTERAEFIRVQCEIARAVNHPRAIPMTTVNEDRHERLQNLRRRERELLTEHWARWVLDLRINEVIFCLSLCDDVSAVGRFAIDFRRGFVETVHCTPHEWFQYGPAIVRVQPIVKVKLPDSAIAFDIACVTGPLAWARGSHPRHNLAALPPLASLP